MVLVVVVCFVLDGLWLVGWDRWVFILIVVICFLS